MKPLLELYGRLEGKYVSYESEDQSDVLWDDDRVHAENFELISVSYPAQGTLLRMDNAFADMRKEEFCIFYAGESGALVEYCVNSFSWASETINAMSPSCGSGPKNLGEEIFSAFRKTMSDEKTIMVLENEFIKGNAMIDISHEIPLGREDDLEGMVRDLTQVYRTRESHLKYGDV